MYLYYNLAFHQGKFMRIVLLKAAVGAVALVLAVGIFLSGCIKKSLEPKPPAGKEYPVYFATTGNPNYYKYTPATGELDSFYFPMAPDEMTVTPDNKELWIYRMDSLYIIDLETRTIVEQRVSPLGGSRFVFSRDNTKAAAGGSQLRIINTSDYSLLFNDTPIGSMGRFSTGDFSPDGQRYYCADRYNYLYRVDLANNNEITRWNLETHGGIYEAKPSIDETKIFFTTRIPGSDYCCFGVFDIAFDSVISAEIFPAHPARFHVSPNGKQVFITAEGNMISILPEFSFLIYDVANLRISNTVQAPFYEPQGLFFVVGRFAVTPDNRWLVGRWWVDPTIMTYDLQHMDTVRFLKYPDKEPLVFTCSNRL